MKLRQPIHRNLQSNNWHLARQIFNVCPIDHFRSIALPDNASRRQSAQKSLKADIDTHNPVLTVNLSYLNIIRSDNSAVVDIDDLPVQHIAHEKSFVFPSLKRLQIDFKARQTNAFRIQFADLRPVDKEFARPRPRHQSRQSRISVVPREYDDIFD